MKTIFVSSTFSDMQYERDAILDTVAPAVNKVAKEYADSVSFCDLRWGINTSELESDSASKKVLNVCLDEIDRSGSPMVVILGNRYGWVPSEDLIRDVIEQKRIVLDDLRKSITALEVEFGAFYSKQRRDILFYFRQVENAPESYYDSDPEYLSLLSKLKEKIAAIPNARIKYYTLSFHNNTVEGLSSLTQMMIQDLLDLLVPSWKKDSALTPFELEQKKHWAFIMSNASHLYARKKLADEWVASLVSEPSLMIKGDPGIGKTTLFSYIAVKLREQGFYTIAYICGLTNETFFAGNILKRIIFSLEQLLQIPHVSMDALMQQSAEEKLLQHNYRSGLLFQTKIAEESIPPVTRLLSYLTDLCVKCQEKKIKVAIMVDALDQLVPDEIRDHLASMPISTSEYVKCVFSCVTKFSTFGSRFRILPPIDRNDIPEAVKGILSGNNKELPAQVLTHIAKKKSADNCLYLSLLLQRLVLINRKDYNAINRLGNDMSAIVSYLEKIIIKSPDSPEKMAVVVIDEAAKRINSTIVRSAVRYLACSKYGLTYDDCKNLLANDFIAVDFSAFIHYLSDFFSMDEAGKIIFSHRLIKNGLLKSCSDKSNIHQVLFCFFNQLEKENQCQTYESAYHAVLSNQPDSIYGLITEIKHAEQAERIKAAAMDFHQLCMENGTKWIKTTVDQFKNDQKISLFLKFLLEDLCSLFEKSEAEQTCYKQVLRICTNVLREPPQSNQTDESRALYAKALNEYGNIFLDFDKKSSLHTAIEYYRLAVQVSSEIIDAENRAYYVARSYLNLGYALNKALKSKNNLPSWETDKQREEIKSEYYLKAVEILTDSSVVSGKTELTLLLANCYDNLGDLSQDTNLDRDDILSDAEKYYLLALRTRECLYESGVDARGLRTLSRSYRRLIELYRNTPYFEKWKNALDLSIKDVELNRHITELEITSFSRRRFADSCTEQAVSLLNLRLSPDYPTAYNDAYHLYEQAAQIYRMLYEELHSEIDGRSYIRCLSEMTWIIIDKPLNDLYFRNKATEYIKALLALTEELSLSKRDPFINDLNYIESYNALGELENLNAIYNGNTKLAVHYYQKTKAYLHDNKVKSLGEVYAIFPFLQKGMIEKLPWEIYIIIKKYAYRLFKEENGFNYDEPLKNCSRDAIIIFSYLNLTYWMDSRQERDELENEFRKNEEKKHKKKNNN